jgi:ribosomal protein S18 acetylase RimI-like enzyme
MKGIIIQKHNPRNDNEEIYNLWEKLMNNKWTLPRNIFSNKVFNDKTSDIKFAYYIAKHNEKIVGFIAGKYLESKGQIMLILVKEDYQRKGVGSSLLCKCLSKMKKYKVSKVQLGAGVGTYLWAGVPMNLKDAVKFFEANEWRFTEDSVDMIGAVSNHIKPKDIYSKLEENIRFIKATPSLKNKILQFEKNHFPDWYKYFKTTLEKEEFDNILLSIKSKNEIVGSVLISSVDFIWESLLDGKVGTFGSLGVQKSERGKGIGLALSLKAMEVLKKRRMKYCFLGWTYLTDWYGKLGYKVWRKYRMSWKNL